MEYAKVENKIEKLLSVSGEICYLCQRFTTVCGSSSVGRASASQAEGHEFEPRLPLD